LIAILVLVLLLSGPASSQSTEDSIWVAYDGEEKFLLKKAERIPTGKFVTLIGRPLPKVLPHVFMLNVKSGKKEALEVMANTEKNVWVAFVPTLEPKIETQLIVHQFKPLDEDEVQHVKNILEDMLFSVYAVAADIPERASTDEMSTTIRTHLSRLYDPDTTLSQYILLKNGQPTANTLGSELIELMSEKTDRKMLNQPNTWLDAINALNGEIFTQIDETVDIPDNGIQRMKSYSSRVDSHLVSRDSKIRKMWIKKLVDPDARLVPMEGPVATAFRNYINVRYTSTPGLRERLLAQVEILQTPLEQTFRSIFQSMRRIVSNSYSAQTLSFLFASSDLLRYGTVDFTQGYVTGLKKPRGFLVFSFYPSGPEERTPTDGRSHLAISVGYSVTGGDDAFFLAGMTLRVNRLLSVTGGRVTPTKGGRRWYGFWGVAGDVTVIPFLKDLFTIQP
jgi:hypothetical protein